MRTLIARRMLAVAGIIVFGFLCVQGNAQTTPFPGSAEIRQKFVRQAEQEGLQRIWETDLDPLKTSGFLIPLPHNAHNVVDDRLEKKFRYVTHWAIDFLEDFGKDFLKERKRVNQVNSAVRTVEHQRELKEGRLVKRNKRWIRVGRNANAADYEGPEASSHLYASTIDIAKMPLNKKTGKRTFLPAADISWMRDYLKRLRDAGCIEVIEEFNQAVFHIMVFKEYANCTASLNAKTES
ncbi:MAG: DUF5715 family protein [bacterium]|nr:DUF5715 family protein [bacterium]